MGYLRATVFDFLTCREVSLKAWVLPENEFLATFICRIITDEQTMS